jgi:hypothetical protein
VSTNPIEALLLAGASALRFPQNSRYHGVAVSSLTLPGGRPVAFLRRRFVPRPESLALLSTTRVQAGDRLDNLAATHLGDPELFWRLCDANAAMRPDELTEEAGRELRVALPEGVPGSADG